MSELQKRILTALIGGALFLFLILPGGFLGATFVTTVLSIAMSYEFATMFFKSEDLPAIIRKRRLLMVACGTICAFQFFAPGAQFSLALFWITVSMVVFLYRASRLTEAHFRELTVELSAVVLGIIYVGVFPSFLPLIRRFSDGSNWIMSFLITHWLVDTGAYFIGKKWGRTRLCATVSPKKSVEGAVGGVLTAALGLLVFRATVFSNLSLFTLFLIAFGIGSVAQVGDLFESLLKRAAGVKDSGALLPGHGGVLDRFDGVVFTLPLMYTLIRVFS